jgi:hypothetical protein
VSADPRRIEDAVQGAAAAQVLEDAVRTQAVALVLSPAQAETALQILEEREYAKLALLAEELHQVQRQATAILQHPLESALEAHRLNTLLGRGAKVTKELESLRKSRVDPLNAEVRNVNGLFKAVAGVLEDIRAKGERHIIAFTHQERARVQREEAETRRRQEEAARKEAEALAKAEAAKTPKAREAALARAEMASREQTAALLATPQAAPRAFRSEEATSFTTERWVFQVVKPEDIPRQYLCPDEKAIKAAVAAGVREIPGVAITQEDGLTVRTR